MTKEEVLDLLRAISVQIDEGKVSDYELDDRVSELEALTSIIEDTKSEIKELSEKLTDDRNYKSLLLVEESIRFNLEDNLASREKEEAENLENIKNYQSLIESTERNIAAHELLISLADRKYGEELDAKGPELRDSMDLTDEEFEALRKPLAGKNTKIEEYRRNLQNFREDLVRYKEKLAELSALTAKLNAATVDAREDLEFYIKSINENNGIDVDAKRSDEEKLKNAEARLAEYEIIEKNLSYDHDRKIKELITGYNDGSISHKDLVDNLKELKGTLKTGLIDQGIEQTYNSEELFANMSAVDKLKIEIAELEARLANGDNYMVSPFVIERNNRNLIKVERNIENVEKQISNYRLENENLNGDNEVADELIEELEVENASIQRQIRRAGVAIDPEVEKALLAKIASNKESIEYLKNTKTGNSEIIEHNEEELGLLDSKKSRFESLHERMSSSLNDRNSIDAAARRLDEIELSKKRASLEALQRRGLVSNISLIENIDKLIESSLIVAEENISNENKQTEEVVEEKLSNEKEQTEEVVEEKTDSNKPEMDPIELGDTRGWRVKYSGVEDENLARKAKNGKFVKALKVFFVGVLCVIPWTRPIGVTLSLIGVSSLAIKKIMTNAQNNPSKYINATREDVECEIRDELQNEGINLETLEKSSTLEDQTIEQEITPDEGEITINVNNGESFNVDVSEEIQNLNNGEENKENEDSTIVTEDDTVLTENMENAVDLEVQDEATSSDEELKEEDKMSETISNGNHPVELTIENLEYIRRKIKEDLNYDVEVSELTDELEENKKVR